MKVITDPTTPLEFDTVVTIGVFDGVHIGHRKIFDLLVEKAHAKGVKSLVVTFDPHPITVLKGTALQLIVPLEERIRLLEDSGVDLVVCFTFSKEFSEISAERFFTDIIVSKLRAKSIFVGPNFFFGKNREGDLNMLHRLGEEHGVETNVVEPAVLDSGIVSSTIVRNLITEGRLSEVGDLLGRPYSIAGKVIEGERRGRQLGFPTANVETPWQLLPKMGVYATIAELGNRRFQSITNVGIRPTFGHNSLLIETHIFDFNDDIYGEPIRVHFIERLRDEKKFDGIDALSLQISKDVEHAKRVFSGAE